MPDPTDDQRRMAYLLNLRPDAPEDWPMEAVDWLIEVKETAPATGDWRHQYYKVLSHKVLRRRLLSRS